MFLPVQAEGKENLDDGGPRALGRSIAQHGCAALQPLAELGEGSDGGAQLLQQVRLQLHVHARMWC